MYMFQLLGDMAHVLSIFILLCTLFIEQTRADVSGKTQLLLAITYTARYLDVFVVFISIYNTFLKLFYVITSYIIVLIHHYKWDNIRAKDYDSFFMEFLITPAVILALLTGDDFNALEILWSFSIYLEAIAILPQSIHISNSGAASGLIALYIFLFGTYRGLYVCSWISKFMNQAQSIDVNVFISGSLHVMLCYLTFAVSLY